MGVRHKVSRGDSLWSLANIYLGNGTRYPQIYDYHNREAKRCGLHPIENRDLIFVGQTILIPPRQKLPEPGNGTKAEGDKRPIPLDLKVTYSIGKDTPPIIYAATSGVYSIKAEMSGKITIENKTPGNLKYVHNYELAMSKNSVQAKQKLHGVYDPAIAALTAEPEMGIDMSGRVIIKAPIAANAGLGLYTVEVLPLTPSHLTGSIKSKSIKGTLEIGQCRYEYSADIEFKIDVVKNQRLDVGPETVRVEEQVSQPQIELGRESIGHTSKWDQMVKKEGVLKAMVTVFIGAATIFIYRFTTKGVPLPVTNVYPLIYTIDMNNNST